MGYCDAPLGDQVVLVDQGHLVGLEGNREIHWVVLEGLEAWGGNRGVRLVVLEVGHLVGPEVGLLEGREVLDDGNHCLGLQVVPVGADGKVGVVPQHNNRS